MVCEYLNICAISGAHIFWVKNRFFRPVFFVKVALNSILPEVKVG